MRERCVLASVSYSKRLNQSYNVFQFLTQPRTHSPTAPELWKGMRASVLNGQRCDGREFNHVRELSAGDDVLPGGMYICTCVHLFK